MPCVNKNLPGYKELADQLGDTLAESLVVANKYEIPTLEQAVQTIRGTNVLQYKKTVQHLQKTTSADVDDLVNNMNRILQKYDGKYYVVKGTSLSETPTPVADIEIQQKHVEFLNTLNKEFGPIFQITQHYENPAAKNLFDEVVSDIKNLENTSGVFSNFKDFANDPNRRGEMFDVLAEQALDRKNWDTISKGLSPEILDKVVAYNEALNNRQIKAGNKLFNKPNPETAEISYQYKSDNGIENGGGEKIYSLDTAYAKQIADAFEQMSHNPNDPVVKAAYEAMANETLKQFQAIKDAGYTIELYDGKGEPYANSEQMIGDVTYNKHLYVLPTEKEFGEGVITDAQRAENPLLKDSGITDINGKKLLINDVFRFVHDFFGHSERGNGFGSVGEENAWDVHARMYSDLARRAMTTETRGQNSWVNFGPHMRNDEGNLIRKGEPGYLPVTERPFAEQKIGLLPDQFSKLPEEQGMERTGLRIADGTYRVEMNQSALDDVVEKNKSIQPDYFDKPEESLKELKEYPRFWSEEQKRSFSLANTSKMLQDKFGIPIKFVEDPNSNYRAKYSGGEIVINNANVTPDTPFHEIMHPFLSVMKSQEPEVFNSLKQDLLNSEEGKKILEETKTKYPELNPDAQIDEAIAEHIGRLAGERNLESKPWYKKFMDWMLTTLANMGIRMKGFRPDMSLSDFADLILDPSFTFEFNREKLLQDEGEYFQKVNPERELEFENTLGKVMKKLEADVNIPARTEEEKSRKYFSKIQLEDLQKNKKDIGALDNFVVSALSQTKKIAEKFENFKTMYEKKGKKSPGDIKNMMNLLYQIENNVVLYSDLRPLVRSMKDIFPDEADNWGSLVNYLDRQDKLIDGYKKYAQDATAEWLMPYMQTAINSAKASGKIHLIVSKETLSRVSDTMKAQGVTNQDAILREAVKQDVQDTLTLAKSDATFFSNWFSGVLNEKDAISQLVGLALSDEIQKAHKKSFHSNESIKKALRQERGKLAYVSEKQDEEFHKKFLRQADSYEYAGLDKDGKEKYEYVKRWAFHEKYLWDKFYNAKREFMEKLGPRPSKDSKDFEAWKNKREKWYAENAIGTEDKNGRTIYIPAAKYKNPEFDRLMTNNYYKTLYNTYKESNDKLGHMGLKYGMIPQVSKGKNLFSDVVRAKSLKEGLGTIGERLRKGVGEQEHMYYAQNIEGLERKTVPINHVRLLDESDLSFNLADSVARLARSSNKYDAIKEVEPHVMVLKNFINGNAYLKVDKRLALQNSAKGFARLAKGSRKIIPVEAKRSNDMLNSFLDDVVYGEGDERPVVQLWGSKFVVYDKNDTSNNGKPLKETVKNFEDLKQRLNRPDLNYSSFELGKPVEFENNVVTLASKDWNLSLNKAGNFAGIVTALQSMAFNVNAAIGNVGIGNVQNFIEASGSRYFNIKDWGKAQKEYWGAVLSGKFLEDTRGEKSSEISQLLSHYDAIQGEFEDELGKPITAGVANRLFRRDKLFFLQKSGEHQIQTTGMLAALRGQKVETNSGETISLRDAWIKDADNNIKLRDDVKWTEEDDRGFRNRLNSINKELNGNYSKIDKAKLQRVWWGRSLMMFRKYIYNAFKGRYGKEQINYERGNVTEGYYRSFFDTLKDQMSEYILNRKFRPLTDSEKYAVRRVAADVGVVVALFALYKATDDHDDQNDFNAETAFLSRRMISDTVQFFPIVGALELWKMVKDPSASMNSMGKLYDALSQIVTDPEERYTKTGPGYTKGELKWKVKLGKIIPIYRQWLNIQDPKDMLKYYQMNTLWYNEKKKDQKQRQEQQQAQLAEEYSQ